MRGILDDLVETTTRDLKLLDELETEGLEMRINARAVVVLPWLVLVALDRASRAVPRLLPVARRRRDAGASPSASRVVGVFVLGRLGREPVEERVFGPAENS